MIMAPNKKEIECDFCGGNSNRILSVPAGYKMKGYNAKNGYSKEGK